MSVQDHGAVLGLHRLPFIGPTSFALGTYVPMKRPMRFRPWELPNVNPPCNGQFLHRRALHPVPPGAGAHVFE